MIIIMAGGLQVCLEGEIRVFEMSMDLLEGGAMRDTDTAALLNQTEHFVTALFWLRQTKLEGCSLKLQYVMFGCPLVGSFEGYT